MNASLNALQATPAQAQPLDLDALFRDSHIGDVLDGARSRSGRPRAGQERASAISPRCCWSTLRARRSASAPARRRCTCASPAIPGTGKTTVALRMARDPASARLCPRKAICRGDARRSGRPVHRPHRAEDQGGVEARDGRRAVHRRGVLPLPAGERARLRPGGDRDPAAGDGEPARGPGRDPGRLQGSRWSTFFRSNPGMSSRIAHHIEFPDYTPEELLPSPSADARADALPARAQAADAAFREYIERRIAQPHFANARSVRNALDRARLRQASRLFAATLQGGDAMTG